MEQHVKVLVSLTTISLSLIWQPWRASGQNFWVETFTSAYYYEYLLWGGLASGQLHFTVVHEICSFSEYSEGVGIKEIDLLSVLQWVILLIMRVPDTCLFKATEPSILYIHQEESQGSSKHQALLQSSFLIFVKQSRNIRGFPCSHFSSSCGWNANHY